MAVRIVGVDLPQNKRGEIGLTYIFGIGRSSAAKILNEAGVDVNIKVKDWTDDQAAKIREIIGANYKVEGDLRSVIENIEKKELVVRADKETKSSEIMKVMKAAQNAGFEKLIVAGEPLTKKQQEELDKNSSNGAKG